MTDDTRSATIVGLFRRRAADGGDRVALHVRRGGQSFDAVTWSQLAADVRRTAALLLSLGVERRDRVAMISPNRYEWIVCDLGIQLVGAVHVPCHATLAGPQFVDQLRDSGAKVVLLADDQQALKLVDSASGLPDLAAVLSFEPVPLSIGRHHVEPFQQQLSQVPDAAAHHLAASAAADVQPDDLATILYTSGTTGEPKGVMLSQNNLASNALAALAAFSQQPEDLRLSWLPLSHIFARTCDLYTWLATGCQLALVDGPATLLADCELLRPTLMNGVPYFFEKVQRALVERGYGDTLGALKVALGGRLRAGCSGGAPLPDHVADFYERHGVLLLQGYGLTETSPVISTCTEQQRKLGTVGRPIPGVEVRIAADGEILTRGPHVMLGYWNKPQATAETIRDGWLHTGDVGQIDADGFLRITGRKKEIIVTSAGKNVAPAYLEALLTADPLIRQALVVGDARNYLTALIVPELDALRAELEARGYSGGAAHLLDEPHVRHLYAQRIAERLSCVSHYEQVQKFSLLAREFSVDRGELTLTLKLRRQVICANFAAEIEAMYAD